MEHAGKLKNDYVKEYYDAQVGGLPGTYTDDRWHSSKVREFEFRQTLRALRHALGGRSYERGIEVGPGDGVWTPYVKSSVKGRLLLIEQSSEMLVRAKERLAAIPNLAFENSDFLAADPEGDNDLVVAIRCFEYFEDKEGALKKMRELITRGGKIIIITKNKEMLTTRSVQGNRLHSDQVSRSDIRLLAGKANLVVESIYPAVLRWKASWAGMRMLFDVLHRIAVWTNGVLAIPFFSNFATESYVYILRKDV